MPHAPAEPGRAAENLPPWLVGPCLETAARLPHGVARLVYLDPPFLTGRRQVGTPRRAAAAGADLGPAAGGAASAPPPCSRDGATGPPPEGRPEAGLAAGGLENGGLGTAPGARPGTATLYAFDDRWPGRLATYLPWLEANLRALLPLLMPGGSLVLHLDARAVHYAKVLLDRLMGEEAFVNEIIWHYTGGGRSKSRFSNKHDTLLWYATGRRPLFHADAVRVPYKPTSGYARGGIVSAAGKRYLPHPAGTPVDDVWDIPIVNPMSAERVGYPTQKPLALLERLIAALTDPGDLVVDLFCGSGTTLVAAARLGRRWIGGDRSPAAVACARRRMETSGT